MFWQENASDEMPALATVEDDDFLTDEDRETESSHEDEELRWKKPKEWDTQVRNKPLLKKLGDLVWKAPVDRGSLESANVGLNVEPEFEMKAGEKFLDMFFDALPRRAFFRDILVRESKRYASAETESFSPGARPVPDQFNQSITTRTSI